MNPFQEALNEAISTSNLNIAAPLLEGGIRPSESFTIPNIMSYWRNDTIHFPVKTDEDGKKVTDKERAYMVLDTIFGKPDDFMDENGNNILHFAVNHSQPFVIRWACDRSEAPGKLAIQRNSRNETPFSLALGNTHFLSSSSLATLLHFVDIDEPIDGTPPLFLCSSAEKVEHMLTHGANMFAFNKEGRQAREFLLDKFPKTKDAFLNATKSRKDKEHNETIAGRGTLVSLKKAFKTTPNPTEARGQDGETFLWHACQDVKLENVDFLIKQGCSLFSESANGNTPIGELFAASSKAQKTANKKEKFIKATVLTEEEKIAALKGAFRRIANNGYGDKYNSDRKGGEKDSILLSDLIRSAGGTLIETSHELVVEAMLAKWHGHGADEAKRSLLNVISGNFRKLDEDRAKTIGEACFTLLNRFEDVSNDFILDIIPLHEQAWDVELLGKTIGRIKDKNSKSTSKSLAEKIMRAESLCESRRLGEKRLHGAKTTRMAREI